MNDTSESAGNLWRNFIIVGVGLIILASIPLALQVFGVSKESGASTSQPSDPAAMVGCRLSVDTPYGVDEGGKAVDVRRGPDDVEVHAEWGWFDDDGTDLSATDPSYEPPSYSSERWIPVDEVRGYTCDGGNTWTWLNK